MGIDEVNGCKSEDEIIVRKSQRNASDSQHARPTSSALSKKRLTPTQAQEYPSKRGRHGIEKPKTPQIGYQGQEKRPPPGEKESRGHEYNDSPRLSQSLLGPTNMIRDANMLSGTNTPPRHGVQRNDTPSIAVPDTQHLPSPPDSDAQTRNMRSSHGNLEALTEDVSPGSNTGATSAIESAMREGQRRSTYTTDAGSAKTEKQVQLAPSSVTPENEVSRLGEQTEPRIGLSDVESLQPCKFLTDNALLFGLQLFLRDQTKSQVRERCRTNKDSRPRRGCSDGEVEQILMQLNYEDSHWLFASIDFVRKRWSARDPWKGAPHLERAWDDVKIFLCNEKIDEWTEVVSSVCILPDVSFVTLTVLRRLVHGNRTGTIVVCFVLSTQFKRCSTSIHSMYPCLRYFVGRPTLVCLVSPATTSERLSRLEMYCNGCQRTMQGDLIPKLSVTKEQTRTNV